MVVLEMEVEKSGAVNGAGGVKVESVVLLDICGGRDGIQRVIPRIRSNSCGKI